MTSTGSPLAPESFDFVYAHIKRDVHLASISGGTDIVGCFVGGNPIGPVWRGEIQARGARHGGRGVRRAGQARARPERGAGLHDAVSRRCRSASGTTRTARKYHAAYFERFPGVWHHGDYVRAHRARRRHHLRPLGRRAQSRRRAHRHGGDLPPGRAARRGRREPRHRPALGPRRAHRAVRQAARRRRSTTQLEDRIRQQIRRNTTPRHVPARIVQVSDIPRTKSGKIVELAVRDVVHGRE